MLDRLPQSLKASVPISVTVSGIVTLDNLSQEYHQIMGDDDEESEKKVVLSNDDYTEVARVILEGVGGKENVTSIDNCVTRLRLEVKDNTLVNEKVIKSAGVSGVIRPGKTSVQVVVGTNQGEPVIELDSMAGITYPMKFEEWVRK